MKDLSFIDKDILAITKYNGTTEKELKRLSASSFNDELLQLWLKYKYGVIEQTKVEANTLGTLVHLGLENLANDNVEIELRSDIDYNGYTLSCATDYINHKEKVIGDFKITKRYTYEKFDQDNNYAWQLRFNKYILSKIDEKYKDYTLVLFMLLKDYEGNFKTKRMEMLQKIVVDDVDDSVIENKIDKIIEGIEPYIEHDTEPPQCKELFWGNEIINGKKAKVPKRCKYYCGYNKVCPYYKENTSPQNIVDSWL